MKIGFTSTTFKQLSPEKIIPLAVKAGADCIEWSDVHVPAPAAAKELAAQCEIACSSIGSYYKVGEADAAKWENICQTAVAMGAGFIRVWLGDKGSGQTSEADYAALLADAKAMLRAAESHGLAIVAEAHPNTYNDTCETSVKFLRELNEPAFGTYFQSLYQDMPGDLDRLAQTWPWLRAAHVSFSEVQRNRRFMPRKNDCVERIVKAMCEKGFSGPILLEFCKNSKESEFLKDMERLRRAASA